MSNHKSSFKKDFSSNVGDFDSVYEPLSSTTSYSMFSWRLSTFLRGSSNQNNSFFSDCTLSHATLPKNETKRSNQSNMSDIFSLSTPLHYFDEWRQHIDSCSERINRAKNFEKPKVIENSLISHPSPLITDDTKVHNLQNFGKLESSKQTYVKPDHISLFQPLQHNDMPVNSEGFQILSSEIIPYSNKKHNKSITQSCDIDDINCPPARDVKLASTIFSQQHKSYSTKFLHGIDDSNVPLYNDSKLCKNSVGTTELDIDSEIRIYNDKELFDIKEIWPAKNHGIPSVENLRADTSYFNDNGQNKHTKSDLSLKPCNSTDTFQSVPNLDFSNDQSDISTTSLIPQAIPLVLLQPVAACINITDFQMDLKQKGQFDSLSIRNISSDLYFQYSDMNNPPYSIFQMPHFYQTSSTKADTSSELEQFSEIFQELKINDSGTNKGKVTCWTTLRNKYKRIYKNRKFTSRNINGKKTIRGCSFCKSNCETYEIYSSHTLKEKAGKKFRITCPVLRKLVCEYCGDTGDNAHTRSYCPKLISERGTKPLSVANEIKKTKHFASGKLRKEKFERRLRLFQSAT